MPAPDNGGKLESRADGEERPLAELVAQVSRDGSLLLKQELELAKQELGEKARGLTKATVSLAVGGLVLYAGVLALVAALALLLALALPAWLAAGLVGLVVTGVGAVMVGQGKKKLTELDLEPKKTLESVKRDVEVVEGAMHDRA